MYEANVVLDGETLQLITYLLQNEKESTITKINESNILFKETYEKYLNLIENARLQIINCECKRI